MRQSKFGKSRKDFVQANLFFLLFSPKNTILGFFRPIRIWETRLEKGEWEGGEGEGKHENFSMQFNDVREIRTLAKRVDVVSGVVGRQCRGTRDAREKWKEKWKLRERRGSNRFRGKHVSHPGGNGGSAEWNEPWILKWLIRAFHLSYLSRIRTSSPRRESNSNYWRSLF